MKRKIPRETFQNKPELGAGLMSIVVAMGLLGILGMGMTQMYRQMGSVNQDLKSREAQSGLAHMLDLRLKSLKFCTANLKGLSYPSQSKTVFDLYEIDVSGLLTKNLFLSSSRMGGLKLVSTQLVHKQFLGQNQRVLAIEVLGQKKLSADQVQPTFDRTLVTVEIDPFNNTIEKCIVPESQFGQEQSVRDEICLLATGGEMKYDPIAQGCITAFEYVCNEGNLRSAACVNAPLDWCESRGAIDLQTGEYTIERPIEAGAPVPVSSTEPQVAYAYGDWSTNSCQCYYAAGQVDLSNAKCVACCRVTKK